MEEKVLYVKLPEGTQYRKVIVAEDVAYSEECKMMMYHTGTAKSKMVGIPLCMSIWKI